MRRSIQKLLLATGIFCFLPLVLSHAQSVDPVAPLPAFSQEILIGGLFDFTGPTSKVSRDYARGASDAVKFLNKKGGIGGSPLRLMVNDYGSRPLKALEIYNRYVYFNEAFVILGWGKADTRKLAPKASQNKVVYMSADFEAELADPSKYPYHFFIGASYSDQARSAMKWAFDHEGKKVCFLYPDLPFGQSPIKAGKEYARELGLTLGPDILMDLKATDAGSILNHLNDIAPDYVWVGNVAPSTLELMADAARLNFTGKFLINCWGMNEDLAQSIGEASEVKAFGFLNVRPFHFDVPEKEKIKTIIGDESFSRYYNLGWASITILAEGLQRAKKAGNLNGPGLKAALETLRNFETGGLTLPVTYTAQDHRATVKSWLYGIKGGKLSFLTEVGIMRQETLLGW